MGTQQGAYPYLDSSTSAHAQQNAMGMAGIFGSSVLGGHASIYSQAQNSYTPETEEQREERRAEREARIAEELAEKQRKEELRSIYRPLMIRCFIGAWISISASLTVLILNLSFHNVDYDSIVGSALLWFMQLCLLGFSVFLGYMGVGYRKIYE